MEWPVGVEPAQHHVQNGLVRVADDGLSDESGQEEGPERHVEVAAADAAQVEGDVRVGRHEQHPVEAFQRETETETETEKDREERQGESTQ